MPISALEKLQAWLATYPCWEEYPANICVLPKGMEEISRWEDVLGNSVVGCRYYVTLIWETTGCCDEAENARRLLDFQKWVQEQSVLGITPKLGDVPAEEYIHAEKGGYTPSAQIAAYTTTLVVDFMKVYEEKTNGKN